MVHLHGELLNSANYLGSLEAMLRTQQFIEEAQNQARRQIMNTPRITKLNDDNAPFEALLHYGHVTQVIWAFRLR